MILYLKKFKPCLFRSRRGLLSLSLVASDLQLEWLELWYYDGDLRNIENKHQEKFFERTAALRHYFKETKYGIIKNSKAEIALLLLDQISFFLKKNELSIDDFLALLECIRVYEVELDISSLLTKVDLNSYDRFSLVTEIIWTKGLFKYLDEKTISFFFSFDMGDLKACNYLSDRFSILNEGNLLLLLISIRSCLEVLDYSNIEHFVDNLMRRQEEVSDFVLVELASLARFWGFNMNLKVPMYLMRSLDERIEIVTVYGEHPELLYDLIDSRWNYYNKELLTKKNLEIIRLRSLLFEAILFSGFWIKNSKMKGFLLAPLIYGQKASSFYAKETSVALKMTLNWLSSGGIANGIEGDANLSGNTIKSFLLVLLSIDKESKEHLKEALSLFFSLEGDSYYSSTYHQLGLLLFFAVSILGLNNEWAEKVLIRMKGLRILKQGDHTIINLMVAFHGIAMSGKPSSFKMRKVVTDLMLAYPCPLRNIFIFYALMRNNLLYVIDPFVRRDIISAIQNFPRGMALKKMLVARELPREDMGKSASLRFFGEYLKPEEFKRRLNEGKRAEELLCYLEKVNNNAEDVIISAKDRKIFKSFYGFSPKNYQMLFRLENAKGELLNAERPIAEIASSWGFKDQAYFTREFRKRVGMTPKKYRSNNGLTLCKNKTG